LLGVCAREREVEEVEVEEVEVSSLGNKSGVIN